MEVLAACRRSLLWPGRVFAALMLAGTSATAQSPNFTYITGSVTGVYRLSGSGATIAVALHQNPGVGHLLVCAATWQSSTATASVNDPNNGAWAAIGAPKNGTGSLTGYRGQMFFVRSAIGAPTTVT